MPEEKDRKSVPEKRCREGINAPVRNYQRELDRILERLTQQKELSGLSGENVRVPTLLLHSCCAPCSSYVLEYLSGYFEITDLFYNPNISPEEEYRYREAELERLIRSMPFRHPVHFVKGVYRPEDFFEAVRGLEQEKEGGSRCRVCYELRMREAAKMAAEGKYDYFTTTLSISPLKNARWINEIGEKLEKEYGVRHLPSDFKKRDGYKRSIELSAEYSLYRQNFCGCIFSKETRI